MNTQSTIVLFALPDPAIATVTKKLYSLFLSIKYAILNTVHKTMKIGNETVHVTHN
jgi:hypothetical protein